MTDQSATNAIVPFPAKGSFDEAIKELCFEIWLFLADRNAEETRRLLAEKIETVAAEGGPKPDRIPSARTIQNWAKTEQWAYKANDLIRNTAEHIDESQIARLFVLSDEAINFAHRLIRGDYDHFHSPGVLAVKWDAAKEMLKFRGLGTSGVVGAPTLEVKISNATIDASTMSADEMAESLRQALLERKQLRSLTGKKN